MSTSLMDGTALIEVLSANPAATSEQGKKETHQAKIVRIERIEKHPNADTLDLIFIGGYQCVSKSGSFNLGDLAVYIQPDSIITQTEPFRFIWENYIGLDGTVPEKRRRITVRKFRGAWSEGLLMPISDFGLHDKGNGYCSLLETHFFKVGDDVSGFLNIGHYDPDAGVESTRGEQTHAPRYRRPKTLKGWLKYLWHKLTGKGRKSDALKVSFDIPEYDVKAFKNNATAFNDGDRVIVTEKIHGSNARFIYVDGTMYAGSRTQWKAPHANTVWNKVLLQEPWIIHWCQTHPGVALYGEVAPTQKGFNYGCIDGEVRFFLFDVRDNGRWVPRDEWNAYEIPEEYVDLAPVLYEGPWNRDTINQLVDGKSVVENVDHIREGIVVELADERRIPGIGRGKLKIVSNAFLDKDSK